MPKYVVNVGKLISEKEQQIARLQHDITQIRRVAEFLKINVRAARREQKNGTEKEYDLARRAFYVDRKWMEEIIGHPLFDRTDVFPEWVEVLND